MKFPQHFSLQELIDSETAQRLGIDNTPSEEIVVRLHDTAVQMEVVRTLLENNVVHVNSGYRCEELERVICDKDFQGWCFRRGKTADEGAWKEYFARKGHPKGYCVDFTCAGFNSPRMIVEALKASSLKFDQLIEEGTWVHISFDPQMRQSVLKATFTNGVAVYD